MTALRVCPVAGCPALTTSGRCATHRAELDASRGSRHARGYDAKHYALRAILLPLAIGTPCPRCGRPMLRTEELDLGHSVDRALNPTARADRIEHAECNRKAGGALGHALGGGG